MNSDEVTTAAQGRTVCTTCGRESDEATCRHCRAAAERSRIARAERWACLGYHPHTDASFR